MEVIPDRVCIDKRSRFFDARYKRLGVVFNGIERLGDVQEYCMSGGWIRIRVRNPLTKKWRVAGDGGYITETADGRVEAFWKRSAPRVQSEPYRPSEPDHDAAQAAAQAKRARKAEKLMRHAS
ncbi:MAG: DUF3297 family protein [Nannocystis sp.]|nr:DUF3297 family protein [Nannocystis sp.]